MPNDQVVGIFSKVRVPCWPAENGERSTFEKALENMFPRTEPVRLWKDALLPSGGETARGRLFYDFGELDFFFFRHLAEFVQGAGFQLADTFFGYAQFFAHLFEGERFLPLQETEPS